MDVPEHTPQSRAELDKDLMLDLCRTMSYIRAVDERMQSLIRSGQVTNSFNPTRGQEAMAVGVAAAMAPGDYFCTTWRGMHDQLARGVDLGRLFAEYFGRSDGLCSGKGGPMHIFDASKGLLLTSGIVGGGLTVAAGIGLACKLLNNGRICVANFGDGASNIGAFHEALNLASVWQLPVVFACQNNRYAEYTPYSVSTSVDRISTRAVAYGMPGNTVDGTDPLAVFAAMRAAVIRAREGGGPSLVEGILWRMGGQTVGDDQAYVPASYFADAEQNDPVPTFRKRVVVQGYSTASELADMDAEIKSAIDAAVAFALASEAPHSTELLTDVYAGGAA
jgi:acetoin:2,6-dichlorophenolindophenol oxidoreductase subunit alpha